jgi:hypothetical protein
MPWHSSAGAGAPTGALAVVADIAREVQPGRPNIFLGLDVGDWPLEVIRARVPPNSAACSRRHGGHLKTLSPALPLI